jgi:hypothetical protein
VLSPDPKIAAVSNAVAGAAGAPPRELHFRVVPLSGGLESAGVFRVQVRSLDMSGRIRTAFVLKWLRGPAIREARIYQQLVTSYAVQLAPRLLSVHSVDGECVLALEDVRRVCAWPWRSYALSMDLVERLARFHRIPVDVAEPLVAGDWDYEAELVAGARRAVELFESVRLEPDLGLFMRGRRPAIRQLAESLPEMRRQLLSFKPFGRAPIHGDVHAGNAIVRRRGGREEPVLLDWGRARIGSPLEDVSSFLQSVGYWEPEVRRRHDSLLSGYLSLYGWTGGITSDVRAAYWLAGASNAFAGALNYYFDLAQSAVGRARLSAARNAGDWLRVIRRAHAFWS